ncbi:flagellar basal-body MS-ring/collar protein FliF [Sphingomonas sp. CJ99]
MENAITPAAAAPNPVVARFADPLKQVTGLIEQPAVKRALPFLFVLGLVAAAALAWMVLATPPQRVLFQNLADSDKGQVAEALTAAGIASAFDDAGSITVAEGDYHRARMLLASQDLPKAAPGGYALLDALPMGVSRAVEGERLRQARETELARSIATIDTVAEARVHLATPEASVFVRDKAAPSASVIVKLQQGRTMSDAQVRSVVNLVASSVPGMKPEQVTIVDQMGALLSQSDDRDGTGSGGDARIDFQGRVEDKYRDQLAKLLTPLLGAGNFSAEIQADVDLDENQATRETYDKENAVVRAEQGNYTTPQADAQAPGGIPGALSNAVPGATTVERPNATPPAPGQTAEAGAATAVAPLVKASENFARSYDVNREVSVTRQMPGQVRRLSVAVLLREPDGGKPRSPVELQQITQLVRAAVGYNAARGDQVTVISRKFSTEVTSTVEPEWYEADWVPMVLRHGTALLIALLVLFMGVRPLVKAMTRKKEVPVEPGPAPRQASLANAFAAADDAAADQAPQEPVVSVEMLESARSYDDRVGLVRGFTRDNPARAALAVRDMIHADGKS